MAINNTLNNGLMSTNPFLPQGSSPAPLLSSSGSTTQALAPTQKPLTASGTAQPTAGGFTVAPSALSPAPQTSYVAPTSAQQGTGGGGYGGGSAPIDYSIHPGESMDAYYQRTQGQSQQQAAQQTQFTSTPSQTSTPTFQSTQTQAPLATGPTSGLLPPPNLNSGVGINTATAQTFPNTVGTLANMSATSSPQYQAALAQYGTANQDLANLRTDFARQTANIGGSRTNLQEAGGEQGLLQNLEAGKEAALTGEMNAAIAAAQAATGQQGTQQQGLGAAAGFAQPQLAGFNQQMFNPITGQFTGGGSMNDAVQGVVQKLKNNQISYPDALNVLSGYGQGGMNALQAALPPGFNVNQSTATGASQQAQTGQQQQYQSASQQAKNLGSQLTQLITSAGINPNDLNRLNSFVQSVAANTSDPNYQTFHNLVNDLANRYAQILTPAGGSVTDKTRDIASSLLDSSQSGQSILQVMNNLDAQAQAVISGTTTAYGTNNTNTTSGAGSGSQPAGWF